MATSDIRGEAVAQGLASIDWDADSVTIVDLIGAIAVAIEVWEQIRCTKLHPSRSCDCEPDVVQPVHWVSFESRGSGGQVHRWVCTCGGYGPWSVSQKRAVEHGRKHSRTGGRSAK